jgi:ubiquinone/menaquinone biosynthesis C-methylase UbiE
MITDTDSLLRELHRVLKSGGVLYATSEHLEIDEFMDIMTKEGLFTLVGEREWIFEFGMD